MNYTSLLEQAKHYVTRFYKSHEAAKYIYHNLEHTEGVVAFASKIARHYQLNEKDFFIVNIAAWFHDMGYCTGEPTGHEQRGADMAAAFLKERGVDEETITSVHHCIMATRMPQSPTNLVEQIVCDADLSHLGTDDFNKKNKQLRKEVEITSNRKISKEDWRRTSVPFLENYRYHTDYAAELLNEGKQKNLDRLKEKTGEKEPKIITPMTAKPALIAVQPEPAKPEEKIKKKKSERPDRGIETMFRISSNNHQRLSDMADNKASIMITTTSIIISVLLSVLLRKLEENRYLTVPVILLLTVCVVTMVFAILATRPSVPPGTFTQKDIDDKKVNLLFFGNFYRMNFDEYDNGMRHMMDDREFLYGSLTRDVYSQGVVLGRKYNLLRVGYNVFMFGIVASVLAFVVATIFWGK
jgi:predicted metal-dependent HD superfamily phosphohydrolase